MPPSSAPLNAETLKRLYQTMLRIRRFDERTVELFNEGLVKGTAHSYVGQEAVATAACAHLTHDDSVISNHRGHGHCIAKGARLELMMAELMGRETGYCRGHPQPRVGEGFELDPTLPVIERDKLVGNSKIVSLSLRTHQTA